MAQSVFRPNQVTKKDERVLLKLTREFASAEEEEPEEEPEYTGPTADDLRREAEAFKVQWEAEKARMLSEAQAAADQIVKNAESSAFEQVKQQSDQAQIIKNTAKNDAEQIIAKANLDAQDIISKAHAEEQEIRAKAKNEGFELGRETGFTEGNEEAKRLVERLHKMIDAVQAKRQEILDGTEQQVVDLVLLMTRKVVKIMSENQRQVVMANVVQALKKVRGRGDVTLRVNLADVKLTTEHISDFIHSVESIQNVSVVEDSSVERGGCIVETDFGAIDARIASQLTELENKILEVAPIKTVNKSDLQNPDA